jgi:hypothetical protein
LPELLLLSRYWATPCCGVWWGNGKLGNGKEKTIDGRHFASSLFLLYLPDYQHPRAPISVFTHLNLNLCEMRTELSPRRVVVGTKTKQNKSGSGQDINRYPTQIPNPKVAPSRANCYFFERSISISTYPFP